MAEESFWKRELKEILAVSSTFYVLFVMFVIMKKAMLVQYDIQIYGMGTALIGSLIIGKVVVIFDKLSITSKMDDRPKIYQVIFRSLIYLIGYSLFIFIEHIIKGLINGHPFSESVSHSFHYIKGSDFLSSLVVVFIAFLFFNTFWAIRHSVGAKALYHLFFKKKTE